MSIGIFVFLLALRLIYFLLLKFYILGVKHYLVCIFMLFINELSVNIVKIIIMLMMMISMILLTILPTSYGDGYLISISLQEVIKFMAVVHDGEMG